MIRYISLLVMAFSLAACSIVDPLVYKLPRQQGNITEFKDLDKLELGMNKAQVRFIMGSPMTVNSFDKNRWDYVYTFKSATGEFTRNELVLVFTDGKLSKIDGTPLVKQKDDEESSIGQS